MTRRLTCILLALALLLGAVPALGAGDVTGTLDGSLLPNLKWEELDWSDPDVLTVSGAMLGVMYSMDVKEETPRKELLMAIISNDSYILKNDEYVITVFEASANKSYIVRYRFGEKTIEATVASFSGEAAWEKLKAGGNYPYGGRLKHDEVNNAFKMILESLTSGSSK